MTEVIFGRGALRDAGDRLPPSQSPVLLLTGGRSFSSSGAEAALQPFVESRRVVHVGGVPANPSAESVAACLARATDESPSVIVAVGGGSVIDTAKLVALSMATGRAPEALVEPGLDLTGPVPQIIAVPTTAGSGAERTPFAVMYVGERKYSVDHPSLEPALAILDPDLLDSASSQTIAASGFDAIGHAMESVWNVNSTEQSRRDAEAALQLAWHHLVPAWQGDRVARERMLEAATLAGAAISKTRTTAAHAMSYHLTARYHVPHGHAVAVTLGAFLEYNADATEPDTVDPRGPGHVRQAVDRICEIIGADDPSAGRKAVAELMQAVELEARPTHLGVDTQDRRRQWVGSVNVERLNNNPRRLDEVSLLELVRNLG